MTELFVHFYNDCRISFFSVELGHRNSMIRKQKLLLLCSLRITHTEESEARESNGKVWHCPANCGIGWANYTCFAPPIFLN